jgi:hypothetical protein
VSFTTSSNAARILSSSVFGHASLTTRRDALYASTASGFARLHALLDALHFRALGDACVGLLDLVLEKLGVDVPLRSFSR